jgi:hypothetical protein
MPGSRVDDAGGRMSLAIYFILRPISEALERIKRGPQFPLASREWRGEVDAHGRNGVQMCSIFGSLLIRME